jgi:hypothetical protein
MPLHKNKRSIPTYLLVMMILIIFMPADALDLQEIKFKLKIVADIGNIRLKPDIGSTIIHQLSKDTVIQSTGKEGDWYHVLLEPDKDKILAGYIHESLVIEVEKYPSKKEEIEQPQEVPQEKEQQQIQVPEKERIEELSEKKEDKKTTVIQPSRSTDIFLNPQLFVSLGANYLSGGEINHAIQGLVDYYSSILGTPYSGEVKPPHLGYSFCLEIFFPLNEHFSLGLGADYLLNEKETRIELGNSPTSDLFVANPKAQALPIRISLSYYPISSVYFKIGGEYYFARYTYLYRYRSGDYFQEWLGESKANGMGIAGGIGFIQRLNNNLSLFIEATGRYAKIDGFRGKNDYKESTGYEFSEEGSLYSYDIRITGDKSYPVIFIRNKKPSESGVTNVRLATVDFSGLSLRAGIKFRF